jgi:hypothetical protein
MNWILGALLLALSQQPSTNQVEQLLIERAVVHRANQSEVLRVARCENTNLTPGLRNPVSGAIGIGQWLPGRGNHWDRTPAWREVGIDIHETYRSGNSNALYYDVDMFAWSFSPEAPAGNKRGWSCY